MKYYYFLLILYYPKAISKANRLELQRLNLKYQTLQIVKFLLELVVTYHLLQIFLKYCSFASISQN